MHRQYSWVVRGWCNDKKEGIFLGVYPYKEKNQHRTLHLDPQRTEVLWSIQIVLMSWLSEIVLTFRNTYWSGTYLLQMESGEK